MQKVYNKNYQVNLTILDFLQNFSIYATNNKKRKIKVVARYQQYHGANAIIERVIEGKIKKGLIWHFQGSGKSLLMVFAAQKLRKLKELRSPTVIIVVDRLDLDSQITGNKKIIVSFIIIHVLARNEITPFLIWLPAVKVIVLI